MPKISIIVPIFGVEKYIERCARSLFEQSFDDIEYVFVNDCTTDDSIKILESIIAEYPDRSVKLIHHKINKGLPQARKTGIDASTGDYILNCDSDDWLEKECCSKAFEAALRTDADVVVFDYWLNDGRKRWGQEYYDDKRFADKDVFEYVLAQIVSPNIWNKLIKREIFLKNNIIFPTSYMAEDWVLSSQIIYYSSQVEHLEDRLYNYFVGRSNESRTTDKESSINKCIHEGKNIELVESWLKELGLAAKYKKEIVRRKYVVKTHMLPLLYDAQCKNLWKTIFPETNLPILFNPYISWRAKVRHIKLMFSCLIKK